MEAGDRAQIAHLERETNCAPPRAEKTPRPKAPTVLVPSGCGLLWSAWPSSGCCGLRGRSEGGDLITAPIAAAAPSARRRSDVTAGEGDGDGEGEGEEGRGGFAGAVSKFGAVAGALAADADEEGPTHTQ